MASPSPVLPEVGSTMVSPGLNWPEASAASIMAKPIRSLTLEPGSGLYASADNSIAMAVNTAAQWIQTAGALTFQVNTDIAGAGTIDLSATGDQSITPSGDILLTPTGGDTTITGAATVSTTFGVDGITSML